MQRPTADPNLYYRHSAQGIVILLLYVNDLKLTGSCISLISALKKLLHQEFKMADLGAIKKFLGIEYTRTPTGLLLHQYEYTLKVLEQFSMEEAHPTFIPMNEGVRLEKDTSTPLCDPHLYRAMVGQLHWLTKTRFEIAFSVGICSRYTNQPQ